MFKTVFGKYRFLVFSIALFLVFDLGVLALNFYTSGKIAEQTERINLAARQRTLSQQLSKATLYIKAQKLQHWPYQSGLNELTSDYEIFRQTLAGFNHGGLVRSTQTNELIEIPAVTTAEGKRLLDEANLLWAGFEESLSPLFKDILITDEEIVPASAFIARYNVPLFKKMNELTNHFKLVADQQTRFLRTIQVIGISLATINFFIILFHYLRQLRKRDKQIYLAKQESDQILSTIDEGVFLIDKSLTIGGQHSSFLETQFQTSNISGKKLGRFLSNYFSKVTVKTTIEFVKLYFAKHIDADLVEDLNPLDKVKASVVDANGVAHEKYFSFSFSRLNNSDNIDTILVSVRDITDSVRLAEQNEVIESHNQQQLALLTQMLPIEPQLVNQFITTCDKTYAQINTFLKQAKHKQDSYHSLIEKIFKQSHKLKGSSATLGFELVSEQLANFENTLQNLRNTSMLRGNDFLPLTIMLKDMISSIELIKQLQTKLAAYTNSHQETLFALPRTDHRKPSRVKQQTLKQRWQILQKTSIAEANQKNLKIDLRLRGFEIDISPEYEQILFDLSSQLIRNSIAHSFEDKQLRNQQLKPPIGQILLSLSTDGNGNYRFTYSDDGLGFDFEKIRQQLVSQGIVNFSDATNLTNQQLIKHTFQNSFSTTTLNNNSLAGKGVGMNVIEDCIDKLNGTLKIRFIKNELTQFVFDFGISLPEIKKLAVNT